MAVLVKSQQQNVFNKDKNGTVAPAFVLRPVHYSTISEKGIIKSCNRNSNVSEAHLQAAFSAIALAFKNYLFDGHNVTIAGVGIFSLGVKGVSEVDSSKAGSKQLARLTIRFRPCIELREMLDNADVELDGVYEIAGVDAKGEKYYNRVHRTLTAVTEPDNNPGGGADAPVKKFLTLMAYPNEGGTVTGGGQYDVGQSVSINAVPNSGYRFTGWSDGVTTAQRNVVITNDLTLNALFAVQSSGGNGDAGGTGSTTEEG